MVSILIPKIFMMSGEYKNSNDHFAYQSLAFNCFLAYRFSDIGGSNEKPFCLFRIIVGLLHIFWKIFWHTVLLPEKRRIVGKEYVYYRQTRIP